jgi:hypothetical protein
MLFDSRKGYLNVLVSLFRVPRAPFCDSFPAFSLDHARSRSFFLGACATPGQLLEVLISDSELAFSWFGVSPMNILICSPRAPGLIVTEKWANSQAYELKRAGAIGI